MPTTQSCPDPEVRLQDPDILKDIGYQDIRISGKSKDIGHQDIRTSAKSRISDIRISGYQPSQGYQTSGFRISEKSKDIRHQDIRISAKSRISDIRI